MSMIRSVDAALLLELTLLSNRRINLHFVKDVLFDFEEQYVSFSNKNFPGLLEMR